MTYKGYKNRIRDSIKLKLGTSMRVISGCMRGKKLESLEGLETRPTLDRVKEALFNIIQFDIQENNVLDLFAGSGSLGIEALSRGAKKATFCDNSRDAIRVIKSNLEKTGFVDKAEVINKDYSLALKKLKEEAFDIIFIDPPYKSDFITKAVDEIIKLDLLTDGGLIVIETDNEKVLDGNKGIEIVSKRKYGSVRVIFVRKGGC